MDFAKNFIDKSLFVKEFLEFNSKISLICRPKHFGKTAILDTLKDFFDNNLMSKHIFQDLKIGNFDFILSKYSNNFLVIRINFNILVEENKYSYNDKLRNYIEKRYLERYGFSKANNTTEQLQNLTQWDYLTMLIKSVCLRNHCLSIILIDDIDEINKLKNRVNNKDDYSKILNEFCNFLQEGINNNLFVYKALFTASKPSNIIEIISSMQSMEVCQMEDEIFSCFFGFTNDEVKNLLIENNLDEMYENVRHWYGGYNSGKLKVFNNSSILNYLNSKVFQIFRLDSDLVKDDIAKYDNEIKEIFKELKLKTKYKAGKYKLFSQKNHQLKIDLLEVLYENGYLTKVSEEVYEIPNYEILKKLEELFN